MLLRSLERYGDGGASEELTQPLAKLQFYVKTNKMKAFPNIHEIGDTKCANGLGGPAHVQSSGWPAGARFGSYEKGEKTYCERWVHLDAFLAR